MTTIAHPGPAQGHGTARDCGCGCGGKGGCDCESRCCDLECLVRPNFFCGQLLSDADLRALVEWTRSRFALNRYRDGWGVVCGLEVTCHNGHAGHDCEPTGQRGSAVYLQPGYAVDCCGNDLVVCEPCRVDLSGVCRSAEDPCAEPAKVGKRKTEARRDDPCAFSPESLLAVDLTLRYGEGLSHGQRAMFRNGCKETASCEYARIEERPCVHVEVSALDEVSEDVSTAEANRWLAARLPEVTEELEQVAKLDLTALIHHVRARPPHSLCFIEQYLCCLLRDKGEESERDRKPWMKPVIPWLWADRLLHLLRCECGSCRTDQGVPIARVLVQRVEARAGYRCQVLMIDERPPFRRPLGRDCRPVPTGHVDLVPYLWQPSHQAVSGLLAAGLKPAEVSDATPWPAPRDFLQTKWSAPQGSKIRLLVVEDPVKVIRVVGLVVTA